MGSKWQHAMGHHRAYVKFDLIFFSFFFVNDYRNWISVKKTYIETYVYFFTDVVMHLMLCFHCQLIYPNLMTLVRMITNV